MLGNYLKIAVRHICRQKGYAAINIAGLAIGMACCLLIFIWIQHELSYDRYHADADRIFRVGQIGATKDAFSTDPITAPPLAGALQADFPQVETVARVLTIGVRHIRCGNRVFYENRLYYADPALFSILTIPFLRGDSATALERPNTVVITEETAQRYFDDEDPIGKILVINEDEHEVTGVVANAPDNTHLKYDLIATLTTIERDRPTLMTNWMVHAFFTYIKLVEGTDPEAFERQMAHIGDRYAKDTFDEAGYTYTFFLQAVPSLHLYGCSHDEPEPPGNPLYLYVFGIVGIFILLIACSNFINLTTARTANRTVEISLRKIAGAQRGQLIFQFFGETFVMVLAAMGLALVLVEIALPGFNRLAGSSFSVGILSRPVILGGIIAVTIITGIAAGAYPGLLLSSFRPMACLSSRGGISRGGRLRKILVVGQFAITVTLLIGTLIVYRQIDFMKNETLGFAKEQKLIIPLRGRIFLANSYETIKAEFLKQAGVVGFSASSNVPGEDLFSFHTRLVGETDARDQSIHYLFCNADFIREYGLTMVAGRPFDRPADARNGFLINEAALPKFGFTAAAEAVGKRLFTGYGEHEGEILGVLKNFHFYGLQESVPPLVFEWIPTMLQDITLTISPDNLPATLAGVREIWERLYPDHPCDYFFLDASFDRQYRSEERVGRIVGVFTFLALSVACLGLLGLTSFAAEQRTREIGIRKIMGASFSSIVGLMMRDFIILMAMATVIAWPLAYFAGYTWLQGFAHRIDIGLDIFIWASLAAIILAILTVSYQSIRAAATNPTDALRHE